MSGNIWKFSDQIDDEDVAMLHRDFITYRMGIDYYGYGVKPFIRLAHEAGAVYKIDTKMVRINRHILEAYIREIQRRK